MKGKNKFLMLALVAVFTCVSFSSCSKDEDDPNKGIGNYYFQLYSVHTNCVDANGNSIANTLKSDWITITHADSQGKMVIGKTDNESARAWFNQNISSLIQSYDGLYAGKNILPDGGWIEYNFCLGSDASYGGASQNATIKITNSGATLK